MFLKGEKCLSPKCSMVKKAYPPGQKGKRRRHGLSEYGKELREKQKLKNWYNLSENQFSNYVKETLQARSKVGDASSFLIKKLETRLDNVIFRLGLAVSRPAARQLISHGHFTVNGRPINIPSYLVKKGDKVAIKPNAVQKGAFKNLASFLKKHTLPSWLKFEVEKMTGEVIGVPSIEEAAPPVEISSIFEFYSK